MHIGASSFRRRSVRARSESLHSFTRVAAASSSYAVGSSLRARRGDRSLCVCFACSLGICWRCFVTADSSVRPRRRHVLHRSSRRRFFDEGDASPGTERVPRHGLRARISTARSGPPPARDRMRRRVDRLGPRGARLRRPCCRARLASAISDRFSRARNELRIPLDRRIRAGLSGRDVGVDWMVAMLRDIAAEEGLAPSASATNQVGSIASSTCVPGFAEGRIRPR